MHNLEQIIIQHGTMINLGNFEDDDALIANESLIAIPVGGVIDGGLPVKIPSLDPERTYFIHQPEEKTGFPRSRE